MIGLQATPTVTMAIVIGAVTIASRLNPVVATDQPLSESRRSGVGTSIVPGENPLAYQTPAQIFARAARIHVATLNRV